MEVGQTVFRLIETVCIDHTAQDAARVPSPVRERGRVMACIS
jgi:hypothetical protein